MNQASKLLKPEHLHVRCWHFASKKRIRSIPGNDDDADDNKTKTKEGLDSNKLKQKREN